MSPDHVTPEPDRFELEEYWFRPATGELGNDHGVTRLSKKASLLLHALVQRRGAVLSRAEIRDLLWPGGKVEFDQGINFLIRQIRKALDESADAPRFIETLPKRGYRILVAVRSVPEERDEMPAHVGSRQEASVAAGRDRVGMPDPGLRTGTADRPLRRGGGPLRVGGFIAVAIATVAAVTFWGAALVGPPPTPILAIVPLETELPDATDRSAVVRAVESLTTSLTDAGGDRLRVLGPAATTGLGSPRSSAVWARDELDACLVLSGSARANGPRSAALFLQVIRTSDQAHLWARTDSIATDDIVAASLRSAQDAHVAVLERLDEVATGCPE